MAIGLLGKKLGMTHVYDPYGRRKVVTAIQVGPCTVVGLRNTNQHGYTAVQLGYESIADKKLTKPKAGQFKKAGVGTFRYVREFRIQSQDIPPTAVGQDQDKDKESMDATPQESSGEAGKSAKTASAETWAVGQEFTVEMFQDYELIDVTGISIGKGFQGGMKRWNWSGGPKTHGSMSHRAPGASGSGTTPGRVYRGHHFPGHMGNRQVTVQNLRIMLRNPEHHLLLVEGSVPGSERGLVMVRKSVKKPGVIKAPQAFQVIAEEEEASSAKAKAKKK